MKKHILVLGLFLVVSAVACGGDGGGGGGVPPADVAADRGATDLEGADVVVGAHAYLPPPLTLQAYTVVLETSATVAAAGQAVELSARPARGAPEGALSYVWDLDGAVAAGDVAGPDLTVSFPEAGRFAIGVTATDGNGDAASAGVLIQVYAAGETFRVGDVDDSGTVDAADVDALAAHVRGAAALPVEAYGRADVDLDGRLTGADLLLVEAALPSGLAPEIVSPDVLRIGQKGLLIDPALLAPGDDVALAIGDLAIPFYRGRPGYAAFVVPPDATAGAASLTVAVGGAVVASYDIELLEMPAASAEPGAKVLEALDLLEQALVHMPGMIEIYLDNLSVEGNQRAALQGMLEVGIDSFVAHRVAFAEAFETMGPEGRAAFERVALANGLAEAVDDLQGLMGELEAVSELADQLTLAQSSTIMSVICAALTVADISDQVAEINDIASGYLDWFDWWPLNVAPGVGPVITFLSNMSSAIGAITDVIGMVAEFLPEFGDLVVEASPGTLDVGAAATIEVSITIVIATKLCGMAADAAVSGLMDAISDKLTQRLGAMIPFAGSAFEAADFDRDEMGTVVGLIYDAISAIAGEILDMLGVEDLLSSLGEAICGLVDDPTLPMDPSLAQPSCGGGGGSWTCTEACVGSVSFDATTTVCGDEKQGSAGVSCVGCDENNCAAGCCSAGTCVGFAQQTVQLCGNGAAPCAPCPEHNECNNGVCECVSNCDTPGEKQCAGNNVEVCTILVENPECRKWQFQEECINGAECVGGVCEGGCHAENCEGCCTGNGDCLDGTTTDACGKDGETCSYCAGGYDECIDGECTCVPQCDDAACGDDGCQGSCGDCPPGEACTPDQQCEALCGNGALDPGEACESDDQCEAPQVCKGNCQCGEPGGGECACGDPGASLTPGTGGCDWPDATECSGWHSLAEANGEDFEGTFPDGTELCAWDCCVVLNCP
jgi:hypothetical protein